MKPEASVYNSKSGDGVTVVSKKKEHPFHPVRKAFHMVRSLKNSLFNRMWWKPLGTSQSDFII